ncbi:lactonase family protein [Paucibacter sp. Y2R2-4]|uniref:lactonase family protein n=1 Tax=Paucibacter sp. Y2R2-4 TaxID=2893553 RepID=UPI0021E38939|nr:lactonase family protein [Paucibacter sp. Y2R2-4]MCV2352295.1 lactonase family protein [Paucibacter sp. Y2R2-4]
MTTHSSALLPVHAYVGTYAPNGQGLYRMEQRGEGGGLSLLGLATSERNPSWLTLSADQRRLYVAHEHELGSEGQGALSCYARDPATGDLHCLKTMDSGGGRPVYLSLSPDEKHLFVANYGAASVAVVGLDEQGCLTQIRDVQTAAQFGSTSLGPQPAAHAPPGSFAVSDHDGSHAHMAALDPTGHHLISTDLGLDLLAVWAFDAETGRLQSPRCSSVSPGAGPRHFVFHPQRPELCYVLNEEASTLASFHFDAQTGRLQPLGEVSSLPPGFVGTSFASGLMFGPGGKHLYCLNRLCDSIAVFEIGADGLPQWRGQEWVRGSYPRSAAFDPRGRYLYVCNQRSDHIAIFELREDGGLVFTGQWVAVGSPVAICFAS